MEAKELLENIKLLKQKQELFEELNKNNEALETAIKIYEKAYPIYTERQKEIIDLHYFEEKNIMETALATEWSYDTVYNDLQKIKRTLNQLIKNIGDDITLADII